MPRIPLLFAALLAASPVRAGEAIRHSGLIAAIDTTRQPLTLDEIGPWRAGTWDIHRVVALTPDTRAVLVSRVAGCAQDGWPGGFER
jgi:hypothetical protein